MKTGVVDIAGITDTGRLRQVNQDDWYADAAFGLYAVADGMGGHAHGEEASRLALNLLRECLQPDSDILQGTSLSQTIVTAVHTANSEIFRQNVALGHPAGTGMGTTLTGLYHGRTAGDRAASETPEPDDVSATDDLRKESATAVLFNVGDSRVYRFRAGQLELLTRDHTIYREWEEAGAEGLAPPRNIILRALGLFDSVDVDTTLIDSCSGDLFMLCSDGLNDMLDDTLLAHCLTRCANATASTIARCLVDEANRAGGEDNITVIIIKHLPLEPT